jgi:hypothetical protein
MKHVIAQKRFKSRDKSDSATVTLNSIGATSAYTVATKFRSDSRNRFWALFFDRDQATNTYAQQVSICQSAFEV